MATAKIRLPKNFTEQATNFALHPAKPDLVILESPFAGVGDTPYRKMISHQGNLLYARAALADSLSHGEAPFASHLLYPQALDDSDPKQRKTGITAGLAWGRHADAVAVYTDRGISPGMSQGIALWRSLGLPIHERSLPSWAKFQSTSAKLQHPTMMEGWDPPLLVGSDFLECTTCKFDCITKEECRYYP